MQHLADKNQDRFYLFNFIKVLTDGNERSEMLSLLLWRVNLFIQVCNYAHIYKFSWIFEVLEQKTIMLTYKLNR